MEFDVLGLAPTVSLLLVLLFLVLFSIVAGLVGGLLGLGGGIFIVPMLVLVFHVPAAVAIAASLVAVIATSSGAASTYVGEGLADIRVGMFLEVATVVGGLSGALVTVLFLVQQPRILIFAFVPVVLLSAALMFANRGRDVRPHPEPDRWADRLRLHGSYSDAQSGAVVPYQVTRTGTGLAFSGAAGVVSGLLGVGGGVFYVPALNAFMNVPFRVAAATSNFMIGVTAVAGAVVYLLAGQIALFWTAPIVIGMLVGSRSAARLHSTTSPAQLKVVFAFLLVFAALLMALRGLGWLP
jgi:hypothetical protein